MKENLQYTLGKEDKLKSRKVIEQLFNEGKTFTLFPFRVIYLTKSDTNNENYAGQLQAGFSVGTKHFKKAVDRNRIKRLMREAYRLQKTPVLDCLKNCNKRIWVFFIYVGKEIPDYNKVVEKMDISLKRLQNIINENTNKTL